MTKKPGTWTHHYHDTEVFLPRRLNTPVVGLAFGWEGMVMMSLLLAGDCTGLIPSLDFMEGGAVMVNSALAGGCVLFIPSLDFTSPAVICLVLGPKPEVVLVAGAFCTLAPRRVLTLAG